MRVLFMPLATKSHYYPMVPLAWAFRLAGHEVYIAAQPPVISSVTRSGMSAISVGGDYDLLANLRATEEVFLADTGQRMGDFKDFSAIPKEALLKFKQTRQAIHVQAARDMAEDLIPFTRNWRPDLVVTDLITLAGPLIAEVVKAPFILHSWGFRFSPRNAPGQAPATTSGSAAICKLYERFGAEFSGRASLCIVDPCPPSLQTVPVAGRLALRYVPYNGSEVEPSWVRHRPARPRICVSWSLSGVGTVGWDESQFFAFIRALATLDAEVIVTTKEEILPGLTQDNVRVARLLPLQSILPTCAVAVSHGGSGSILTAASYGIPQVLIPQQQDHLMNAEGISATGAGTWFSGKHFNPEAIAEAVGSMIHDETCHKAARRLQEENDAQPSPVLAMQAIEQLLGAR
jgi:UDP:flavonoid glycosyltransferase YjiC (YdhE family)